MNYLQICRAVLEFVDRDPDLLTSVDMDPFSLPEHRRVVRHVARHYEQIQTSRRWWTFLRQHGEMFASVASQEDYTSANELAIKDVLSHTLYMVRDGDTAKLSLQWMEFEIWAKAFKHDQEQQTVPVWLIGLPGGGFKLWPLPNDVFHVYGSYTRTRHRLIRDSDVPLWDEEFHDYLVWLGVQSLLRSMRDVDVMMLKEAKDAVRDRKWAFANKYTPDFEEQRSWI